MARITQIQVRRSVSGPSTVTGTWAQVNPILAAGEIGLETDTGKFKIGDGSTLWNALGYSTDVAKLNGTVPVLKGGTGKTTFGATAGVLKTNGSDVLSASLVADADLAGSIDPKKIVGTASTLAQVRARNYQGSNTLDVPPRQFCTGTSAIVSGSLRGYLFTPDSDIIVNKIYNYVGTARIDTATNSNNAVVSNTSNTITFTNGTWSPTLTPAVGATVIASGVGTGAKITAYNSATFTITVDTTITGNVPTTLGAVQLGNATNVQAKAALFTVSGNMYTPIAVSAWQTNPFATASSLYSFDISSTPVTLAAGTTYAVAMLASWTGTPAITPTHAIQNLAGANFAGYATGPAMTFAYTTSDVVITTPATTITTSTGNNTPQFMRLST